MRAETLEDAFKQGYVRACYRAMDAVHTAFRQKQEPARIEAMLRRIANEREIKAEAEAFISFNEAD